MRFASLGSGSHGNATLVGTGDTLVMVDCGFSVVETETRLERLGIASQALDAILVTHEHGDHASGVGRFAARHGIPIWCTPGTHEACAKLRFGDVRHFDAHAPFALDGLEITPVAVPHDAREPVQFILGDGNKRLGILTDTGSITTHILRSFESCDALVLECNHDLTMLANGPYSAQLKARVGGPLGHLSNVQAAEFLRSLGSHTLQHLVAAHLSEKNNRPDLARDALAEAAGCSPDWVAIADQQDGFDWREIS